MASTKLTTAQYAQQYITRFGFHLVPIEPGRKFPLGDDWGNNTLSTSDDAAAFYVNGHSDWNMGVALGPSRVCSFDIDCEESTLLILEEFGLDSEVLSGFPTIRGKGRRIMFRVPDGVDLPYVKLNWPKQDDQSKQYTVFELRASSAGKQRQDVLPPSMHPDTGKPYMWEVQPPKTGVLPEPPDWLLTIWQHWDDFKPQFKDACPWLPKAAPPPQKQKPKPQQDGQTDVIGMFCDAHDIEIMLTQYGYSRKGKRWLSPHSGTGLPGVVLFDDNRAWIHHASDPLCSDDTNQPVNPFDLFCYYEHNGDINKAVKQAAELLGIERNSVNFNQPSSSNEKLPDRSHANIYEPLPFSGDKGVPLAHIENVKELCARLGVIIRYNVIKKEEEILIPNETFSSDNAANAAIAWLESECSLFKMPTTKLPQFITYLADKNQFNPVINWVNSKPWDGVSRLPDFYATVTAKQEDIIDEIAWLKETLIKRWMISAIAAAFEPNGVSAHGVLVLQGDQYLGKTKWFKTLVPSELDLLKDGMLLRVDDRDSKKQILSYWMVELGELDSTFRKSDIAALKSFITNKNDVLRSPYARKDSNYARRTVFFGSVNPREFLHDATGNRRYWTIECEKLDHSHNINMQQVWAEVYQLYKAGEGYYLLPDEMEALNTHNEGFMAIDPIEERILRGLMWDADQTYWREEQATQILIECGIDRPTQRDASAAASLIRKRNGNKSRRAGGKTLLWVPPLPA